MYLTRLKQFFIKRNSGKERKFGVKVFTKFEFSHVKILLKRKPTFENKNM